MNRAEGRKKGLGPGVILVAFIAALASFLIMLQVEKNVLKAYEKELVWCTKTEIVKGTEITPLNWQDYFVQVEMDKSKVPEKRVMLPEEIMGKETSIVLPKGLVLVSEMFVNTEQYVEIFHSPVVAGCKGEDLFQMVSGILRKGDLVHIYTVDEDMNQTYLLWENVPVYQVFDTAGNVITSTDATTPAARINLLLEKANAEQFYNELNNGSIRLVKVWK